MNNSEVEYLLKTKNGCQAEIGLGQHTDGRWMWAVSWWDGISGQAYGVNAKWGHFADTRNVAIDLAVDEGLVQTHHGSSKKDLMANLFSSFRPKQVEQIDMF